MEKKYLLSVCVLCFLLAASLQAEQWFRVSETELTRLETISRTWETDRQNWLSQASELKLKVQTLQTGSKLLNEQLKTEREATKNLRQSFEKSEADQFQRASDYETEIAGLKADLATSENSTLKVRNQRNSLIFVLLFGVIGVLVVILDKFKRVFV